MGRIRGGRDRKWDVGGGEAIKLCYFILFFGLEGERRRREEEDCFLFDKKRSQDDDEKKY